MVGEADRDPRHHTQKMQTRLQETIDHLRKDIDKVDEPQLKRAFSDYERKNEGAWKR
ncbi:hypothetical protein [Microvirga sp. TS319]|uniref:hypothetical protein n=1 Tax=Microvirga sp. TS319 TaxID=3241165 RepID=UPI00351AA6FD